MPCVISKTQCSMKLKKQEKELQRGRNGGSVRCNSPFMSVINKHHKVAHIDLEQELACNIQMQHASECHYERQG